MNDASNYDLLLHSFFLSSFFINKHKDCDVKGIGQHAHGSPNMKTFNKFLLDLATLHQSPLSSNHSCCNTETFQKFYQQPFLMHIHSHWAKPTEQGAMDVCIRLQTQFCEMLFGHYQNTAGYTRASLYCASPVSIASFCLEHSPSSSRACWNQFSMTHAKVNPTVFFCYFCFQINYE